ncbi:MAG: MFS transporter [Betaproteobacteria bacterium]|nr:MFS transporter [Betaproteobacteria bacterium]MBI2959783.1 MFS transporter [Betaproteobacteria bacterium]
MRQSDLTPLQRGLIFGGAAMMLSMSMGIRQSWGLFQPHMIRDIGISAADFSLAIALQNIIWGITQPFVGMLVDHHGARRIAVAGTLLYAAGVAVSIFATSALVLILGAGVCVGIALSCTSSNMAMSSTARATSPAKRSVTLGSVSALGSLGLVLASPLAQSLITSSGWQIAMVSFLGLVAVMLPAAFLAGAADKIKIEVPHGTQQSVGEAIREAAAHPGYVTLVLAFFVCGLQLVFITTHLPTYLEICGIDPVVGSTSLALIGLFNVGGTYFFGWLGGRYSKRVLLGGIYILRSLVITAYFLVPPTATSTLVFAAAMGALWLSVTPLYTGLVIHLFGLRFMTTLIGIMFFSHQVGAFLGAWGGGLIYSAIGSYDLAWKWGVAIGLVAGVFQMMMNMRPSPRLAAEGAPKAQAAALSR